MEWAFHATDSSYFTIAELSHEHKNKMASREILKILPHLLDNVRS
jgi:hypothetical protein